jgi:hypothetical protein
VNEKLQEYADSRGLPIHADRQRGVIRGVKILGTRSQNGRTYLAEAIGQAVPLYEGAKVNVNHAKGTPSGPRDYQDRIGVIRNVTVRADEGLFGDFHFNPKHALAEQLLWDAEHAPQNVGFSHNVQARTARRGDTVVVEAITKVQSVDLVADPATTRGLFESAERNLQSDDASEQTAERLQTLTAEGLREARPDLIDDILADAQNRIDQLQEEVEHLRSSEAVRSRREMVLQLLAEYEPARNETGGPWTQRVFNESFVETLVAATDEAAVRKLIRERIELARDILSPERSTRPLSREQTQLHNQPPIDAKSFARSIS